MLADPLQWSEAVLGKPPAEYCRWIKARAVGSFRRGSERDGAAASSWHAAAAAAA